MMQTCGLTDGFVLTGIIALTYGQVSVNATRCDILLDFFTFWGIDRMHFRVHAGVPLLTLRLSASAARFPSEGFRPRS